MAVSLNLQAESEAALLSNDQLAASTASMALHEDAAAAYGSGGGGSGSSSPSRLRWLGRSLQGSTIPSRMARMRANRQNGEASGAAVGALALGEGGGGGAEQVEAAERLTHLLHSVVNLLAGELAVLRSIPAGKGLVMWRARGGASRVTVCDQLVRLTPCAVAHAVMAQAGDSAVKGRLCQREVLATLMGLSQHMRPDLQASQLARVRTGRLVLLPKLLTACLHNVIVNPSTC